MPSTECATQDAQATCKVQRAGTTEEGDGPGSAKNKRKLEAGLEPVATDVSWRICCLDGNDFSVVVPVVSRAGQRVRHPGRGRRRARAATVRGGAVPQGHGGSASQHNTCHSLMCFSAQHVIKM